MMLLIYIQRILKQKTEPSTTVSVNESPNNILEGSDVDTVAQEEWSANGQLCLDVFVVISHQQKHLAYVGSYHHSP